VESERRRRDIRPEFISGARVGVSVAALPLMIEESKNRIDLTRIMQSVQARL
jgi:hypothetical protein